MNSTSNGCDAGRSTCSQSNIIKKLMSIIQFLETGKHRWKIFTINDVYNFSNSINDVIFQQNKFCIINIAA